MGRLPLSMVFLFVRIALADDVVGIETTEIDVELSKDLASVIMEANIQARCDTLLLEATVSCVEDHVSHIARALSRRVTPVVLHTLGYTEQGDTMPTNKLPVGHFQGPSWLVFVCDTTYDLIGLNESSRQLEYRGVIQFSPLIRSTGKVIYFRDHGEDEPTSSSVVNLEKIMVQLAGSVLSIWILERLPTSESVFKVSSKCVYCNATTTPLGLWRRNGTYFSDLISTAWGNENRVTFDGYSYFDVGYVDNPPHIVCNNTEIGYYDCSGVEWEMILHMSHTMKFGFKLHNFTGDGGQGTVYDEGNITGILGAIIRHEISFGIGGHSISEEKNALIDFTDVYINHPVVFVVQKTYNPHIIGIWLAFEPQVWYLVIFTIFCVAVVVKLAFWQQNRRKLSYRPSMLQSLEMQMKILLGQPLTASQLTRRPSSLLKSVLGIWWFVCLIFSTVYNTNLITSLITPGSPKEPQTLQELLNQGYSFRTASTRSAVLDLITNSDDEEIQEVKLRLGDEQISSSVAYLVEESALYEIDWAGYGVSKIKIIAERLFLTGFAWPAEKHATYLSKMNRAISAMNAVGLIEKFYQHYTHNGKKLEGIFTLREKIGQVNLNLKLLQGAFIFLMIGYLIASMTLVLEYIHLRYHFRFLTLNELTALTSWAYEKIRKPGQHLPLPHLLKMSTDVANSVEPQYPYLDELKGCPAKFSLTRTSGPWPYLE